MTAWKDLKIVFSDANVPGKGEHKIMDFIRKHRDKPNHDSRPGTLLVGSRMMLGLATHKPLFYIICEEFKPNMDRPHGVCGADIIYRIVKVCNQIKRSYVPFRLKCNLYSFVYLYSINTSNVN